jgi:hypothetical protein
VPINRIPCPNRKSTFILIKHSSQHVRCPAKGTLLDGKQRSQGAVPRWRPPVRVRLCVRSRPIRRLTPTPRQYTLRPDAATRPHNADPPSSADRSLPSRQPAIRPAASENNCLASTSPDAGLPPDRGFPAARIRCWRCAACRHQLFQQRRNHNPL